ncbi:MAG: hypothetical protein QOJ81_216 [Chloroflexota bacterium]|jgi:hypothetical protein|nr:hypothetical protein [Chloroflexota bacterium]
MTHDKSDATLASGPDTRNPSRADPAEKAARSDPTDLSEGIGGVPGLAPQERATVSDVDTDNVETERPKPQA